MGVRFPQGGCKQPKKALNKAFSLSRLKFVPKIENFILKNAQIPSSPVLK